jgi:hypothetical protein
MQISGKFPLIAQFALRALPTLHIVVRQHRPAMSAIAPLSILTYLDRLDHIFRTWRSRQREIVEV